MKPAHASYFSQFIPSVIKLVLLLARGIKGTKVQCRRMGKQLSVSDKITNTVTVDSSVLVTEFYTLIRTINIP